MVASTGAEGMLTRPSTVDASDRLCAIVNAVIVAISVLRRRTSSVSATTNSR